MHGMIHLELQRFVQKNFGTEAWSAVLAHAGLEAKSYSALQAYDDAEIVRLVGAGVALTGRSATELLEAFGTFLVPMYLQGFGALLQESWRTLDVIEHTEETIHRVVRIREPTAAPPRLRVERVAPDEVVLHYDSPRKLCAVARGIAAGVARHFDERVRIHETSCMHLGAPECVISISISTT